MSDKFIIEIFKNKTPSELAARMNDQDSKLDSGSLLAASGCFAASLAEHAALAASYGIEASEQLEYISRNTGIIRNYMSELIDRDIQCRAPLRKALKEGGAREIEASRQTSVAIDNEIVCMMSSLLDLLLDLCSFASDDSRFYIAQSASLAFGIMDAAGFAVENVCRLCEDDTFRFVCKREHELTRDQYLGVYQNILSELKL